jgi:hypothetical protein
VDRIDWKKERSGRKWAEKQDSERQRKIGKGR